MVVETHGGRRRAPTHRRRQPPARPRPPQGARPQARHRAAPVAGPTTHTVGPATRPSPRCGVPAAPDRRRRHVHQPGRRHRRRERRRRRADEADGSVQPPHCRPRSNARARARPPTPSTPCCAGWPPPSTRPRRGEHRHRRRGPPGRCRRVGSSVALGRHGRRCRSTREPWTAARPTAEPPTSGRPTADTAYTRDTAARTITSRSIASEAATFLAGTARVSHPVDGGGIAPRRARRRRRRAWWPTGLAPAGTSEALLLEAFGRLPPAPALPRRPGSLLVVVGDGAERPGAGRHVAAEIGGDPAACPSPRSTPRPRPVGDRLRRALGRGRGRAGPGLAAVRRPPWWWSTAP